MMKKIISTILFILVILGGWFMATKKNKLAEYKKKRDFKKTTEPKAKVKKTKSKLPMFVIQKHNATRLHYDFRLEIDGVLVSWAIPKGPSLDPRVKRLAVQTEDHPMDYGKFEGNIPEGEYGAGPVMVWDYGTYEDIKEDKKGNIIPMEKCLKDGSIKVFLNGEKLKGAFYLIRTSKEISGKKKQWLFWKVDDEHADARRNPVSTQDYSVLSGKTTAQIKKTGKMYGG